MQTIQARLQQNHKPSAPLPSPKKRIDTIERNLVYMENIKLLYGQVTALDDVNFRVGRNEVIGLLGNNGAGKTSLIKALIGYHPIASGEIFFDGKRAEFVSPQAARFAGIETVYQDLALIDFLSCSRNFFLGRELQKRIGPFKFLDYGRMNRVTRDILEELGFTAQNALDRTVSSLSGGSKQALAIARAYYFGKKLLILDEPTAALSEHEAELVLRLVIKAKQNGLSVIFATHRAHEVFGIAERFVVLQNGKVYADIKKEDASIKKLEKLLISSRLTAVREMAAGVAHQFKNPLGVMKLSAEMLRDDFRVEQNQEDYQSITQMLVQEIDALNLLLTNFLEFARPPRINKTSCAIQDIFQASLATLPLRHFAHIEVIQHIQPGLSAYLMDKNLIKQVLSNLILNGLQASPPHSKIELRAFKERERFVIEVQDWGCGFDEETRTQIFHPFFSTKTTGAGLGLSIVHRFVEQHHGTIDVHSTPGKGTTFRIML